MRALVGAPGKPGNVEFREVEQPQPGPDDVLIEVKAFALNRGELSLLASRPAGWRPGQDIAGVVVRGAANGGPQPGDRVVALTDYCGWSERASADRAHVGVIPDGVTFEQAASLPVAGLTALRALRVGGPLLGKRVLVTGASGGVGSFAMQLAHAAGAYPTGVSSAADAPDERYDVILESVGGASLAASLHRVAAEGVVAMYGNSSREPTTIPGFPDFAGRAHAKLFAFFLYGTPPVPTFGEDLRLLATLVGEGKVAPAIGATFDWTDFASAYDALSSRKVKGKAVLRVG